MGRRPLAELAVHNGVFCRRQPIGQSRPGRSAGSVCWQGCFPRFSRGFCVCYLGGVRVSACLSAIGASLPTQQESPDQVRDQVGLFVESEVAGVEDVHLGVWHVPAVCLGLLDLERGVVAAP